VGIGLRDARDDLLVAGEIVSNTSPEPSTNSPSMKRPYCALRFRIAVDSGAGAYSRKLMGQSTVT